MGSIRYEKGDDCIVNLIMDMPHSPANIMNHQFSEDFKQAVTRLELEKDSLCGVILSSAKNTFFAGGDLKLLSSVDEHQKKPTFDFLESMKRSLRQLEQLKVPVVAAINGAALGGGWELALSCHFRVSLDEDATKLGLPEVTLGLLPAAGGITRMVRLLGLETALPYLLEGKKFSPKQGKEIGLIHELAKDQRELLSLARQLIHENPHASQPWDQKSGPMAGSPIFHSKMAQKLSILPALVTKKSKGCYPAPEAIIASAVEGSLVDFDTASRIESRYFISLVSGAIAKNMIGTFWFQLNAIKSGSSRPKDYPQEKTKKVGILGAGMMGAGIAFASALRGIDVVLKDITEEKAEKGKSYSLEILTKMKGRGKVDQIEIEKILNRIKPTSRYNDLAGCDLMIEAVYEDQELKALVTRETEANTDDNKMVFASNTSTIPISSLAEASRNPESFIGLHFFSPVDKMPLVEIIVGEKTSHKTLAKAFDFVLQIQKTPIVVNDSRGFFTSRVFGTFVSEGLMMLGEGLDPVIIEKAATLSGMPVGPLAVSDEVSLKLSHMVRKTTIRDLEYQGLPIPDDPAAQIVEDMVVKYQRLGKAYGGGFYHYDAGGSKNIWPELYQIYFQKEREIPIKDMQDRLLFIQSIETVRCLEEGVLNSVRDANVGSILGIGFAPWTGGAIQYINQYGVREFSARAHELATQYGKRFTPPSLLLEKAERNEYFKDE